MARAAGAGLGPACRDARRTALREARMIGPPVDSADLLKIDPFRSGSEASLQLRSDQPDFKFEREDLVPFRAVEGLQQKAGVPRGLLRRLTLKELTDNALDAGATAEVGRLVGHGYFVEDDGPGLDGGPDDIARMFSVGRPMVSSKLVRRPT